MARVEDFDWNALTRLVRSLDPGLHPRRPRFSDAAIVLVLLWARFHHRPVSWACRAASWPLNRRRRGFPSPSTMTRRLRSVSVLALLDAVQAALRSQDTELVHAVDGKPIVVSRHSTDPESRHGRGAGGPDKGYKLHLVCTISGRVSGWRLTPMNTPEPEMARRLVRDGVVGPGYLLADTIFDWDVLHARCAERGSRLLAPRRASRLGKGLRDGNRVGPERRACIAAMETPHALFARQLHRQRGVIERVFARLETRWNIGRPPFYVRRLHRVRRWVQTALILDACLQNAA